jgi:hypothetical protein
MTAGRFQVAPTGEEKGSHMGAGEHPFGDRGLAAGRLVPGC